MSHPSERSPLLQGEKEKHKNEEEVKWFTKSVDYYTVGKDGKLNLKISGIHLDKNWVDYLQNHDC